MITIIDNKLYKRYHITHTGSYFRFILKTQRRAMRITKRNKCRTIFFKGDQLETVLAYYASRFEIFKNTKI